MSEFLNRTAAHSFTNDPIVSPVSNEELADFVRADEDDPVIPMLLKQASGMVVRYLGYDLTPRDWMVIYYDWPTVGTMTNPTLSRQDGYLEREISLPFARIIQVDSVELYGQSTTDFITRQDSIVLPKQATPLEVDPDEKPAIKVEYKAGFDPLPDELKEAVLSLAAYLYMHRGCSMADALTSSGVKQQLVPWRNPREFV